MSYYEISQSSLKGSITIPPSKSQTHRAILFGSLGKGHTFIHNPLISSDTESMINACRQFGASIDVVRSLNLITIKGLAGKINYANDVIHAGNSGIVLRFCAAVGALASNPIVITGDYSIRHLRPMKPLLEGLTQLGVSACSMRNDHFAPVIIKGPIKAGRATISGEDSQPVSALIIASALAEGPIQLQVTNPGEKPWVALTLNWLDRLGIGYESNNLEQFKLKGSALYDGFEYHVPGDLSSAAFPVAAALVSSSEILLKNVDLNDAQGDKELIYVFQKMGAHIEINAEQETVYVNGKNKLSGITVDINDFIDALPILAVVACFAEGHTQIVNASVAKTKECDRIKCVATELRKMGADIVELGDGLLIHGNGGRGQLKGATLNSYEDHRMAMALSVAGLGSKGKTVVAPIDCISKTYPTFLQDFNKIGAKIAKI